jgi:hypothetical protein
MDGLHDAEATLVDALFSLGVRVSTDGSSHAASDITIDTDLGSYPVTIKRWATFPDSAPHRNPDLMTASQEGVVRLVVADRISRRAREDLTALDWSWLDTRGHVRLKAPGLLIDADIPPTRRRQGRTGAFAGVAGVEVSCAILEHQSDAGQLSIRGLSRIVNRSPSTVADVIGALRDEALLPTSGFEADPELFWRASSSWRPIAVGLSRAPTLRDPADFLALGLGEGLEDGVGWALTGDRAAAAYGAEVPLRLDAPPRLYVPDETTARRAQSILGPAALSEAGAVAVIAPVRAACERRVPGVDPDWPLAGWLYVALDLATDRGRGREVLDQWKPDFRVW